MLDDLSPRPPDAAECRYIEKPAGPPPNGAVGIWNGSEYTPLYQLAADGRATFALISIGEGNAYVLRPAA